MKIIFFGSTIYSVEILKELLANNFQPLLVVTQPDRPKGRGLKVHPTEVKEFSLKNNLEVITPFNILDKNFISLLKEKEPDLYIVVAYGKILPETLLNIPKILPLGIHPSFLPKYRGAAPINWALINGEKETGVTLFKISPKMDAGEIIAQKALEITSEDDFLSLSKKIHLASKKLLIENLPLIKEGKFTLIPQGNQGVTFAPKIDKRIAKINWQKDAESIRNLVRGLVPFPCTFSYFREKRIKFLKVATEPEDDKQFKPGEIVYLSKNILKIKTEKGVIVPWQLQSEGKKPMGIGEFINGYHPKRGEKFC